jgi:hypothetical protein
MKEVVIGAFCKCAANPMGDVLKTLGFMGITRDEMTVLGPDKCLEWAYLPEEWEPDVIEATPETFADHLSLLFPERLEPDAIEACSRAGYVVAITSQNEHIIDATCHAMELHAALVVVRNGQTVAMLDTPHGHLK